MKDNSEISLLYTSQEVLIDGIYYLIGRDAISHFSPNNIMVDSFQIET